MSTQGRRDNRAGTVYKTTDGRWRAEIRWKDAQGHPQRSIRTAPTEAEAKRKLRAMQAEVQAAMIYQRAGSDRDQRLAEAMSNVITLPTPKPVDNELARVWVRQPRGAWHLAGGTPSSTWCGRRLSIANGALEQRHGDQPRGRVCSRCGRRASA